MCEWSGFSWTFFLQAHEATLEARASPELSDRMQQLEREVTRYRDESSKAQAEVDRLLEILKEMENEKNDKDKKIAELERWERYKVTRGAKLPIEVRENSVRFSCFKDLRVPILGSLFRVFLPSVLYFGRW